MGNVLEHNESPAVTAELSGCTHDSRPLTDVVNSAAACAGRALPAELLTARPV